MRLRDATDVRRCAHCTWDQRVLRIVLNASRGTSERVRQLVLLDIDNNSPPTYSAAEIRYSAFLGRHHERRARPLAFALSPSDSR